VKAAEILDLGAQYSNCGAKFSRGSDEVFVLTSEAQA